MCITGREANREGTSPSEHCPPGMQILIDPDSHEITIVAPQDAATSSNRTNEGGNAINSNVAVDEVCVEETDSESSDQR